MMSVRTLVRWARLPIVFFLLLLPSVSAQTPVMSGNVSRIQIPLGYVIRAISDGAGGLYVSTGGNVNFFPSQPAYIYRIDGNGSTEVIAGIGVIGFSGDGGPATNAQLGGHARLALDQAGNLFFSDNNRVRKITPGGIIRTVAGNGTYGFGGDGGPGTSAQLNDPGGLAVDKTGNLFIADTLNHRVRRLSPSGVISTFAGNGQIGVAGDGRLATATPLGSPVGLAVDSFGNVYIADSGYNRIYRVAPSGQIATVAGSSITGGFAGDGGPATAAQFQGLGDLSIDAGDNLFIVDSYNGRIRKIDPAGFISTVVGGQSSGENTGPAESIVLSPTGVSADPAGNLFLTVTGVPGRDNHVLKLTNTINVPYAMSARGGVSWTSSGASDNVTTGYAAMVRKPNTFTPNGLAVFAFRPNDVLVSESAVPAADVLTAGRIYAEVSNQVDTGIAIANPNPFRVRMDFFFTDHDGNNFGLGTTTLPADGQVAAFLDQEPFNAPRPFQGTLTFITQAPTAAIALRGLTNERREFLMSTLPVANVNAFPTNATRVIPHYADGGGWSTQILLVNPASTAISGSLQFVSQSGVVTHTLTYSVAQSSSKRYSTAGIASGTTIGSVRVNPATESVAPVPFVIFSYKPAAITVAEAGVPPTSGTILRMYVESSGPAGQPGAIQSGIAVANESAAPSTITFELTGLDGTRALAPVSIDLPAFGQTSLLLAELFPGLADSFKGILRISSSAGMSAVGLRLHNNERNEVLITTTPPNQESFGAPSIPTIFPHIVDGGGYTTQFIMFGSLTLDSSGNLSLTNSAGHPLNLTFH